MIVNFRRQRHSPEKNLINDQEVEVAGKYKYLGTTFQNKLNWDENTDLIVRKGRFSCVKAKVFYPG